MIAGHEEIAVPRYFFDVHDGETFIRDPEGLELEGIEAVYAKAQKALPETVKEERPEGDRRDFAVLVKNEAGQMVLRVTRSLVVENTSQGSTANT